MAGLRAVFEVSELARLKVGDGRLCDLIGADLANLVESSVDPFRVVMHRGVSADEVGSAIKAGQVGQPFPGELRFDAGKLGFGGAVDGELL